MINFVDITLIFMLIVLNGLFAMSEIAIVSARKARLQQLESEQRKGAQAAILLHNQPSRFFSTVQVGITSVGILSGAIGENALTITIHEMLIRIPSIAHYAQGIALTVTVLVITYLSVVIGELVPKQLAMRSPETISLLIARPMTWLSKLASPLVWLLSSSSHFFLLILGMQGQEEIVANVLKLDEQRVGAIMTARNEVFYIDLNDTYDNILNKLIECHYSQVVICKNGLENTTGILQRSDLLKPALSGAAFCIENVLRLPLYIPDFMTIPHLLDNFRKARTQFAIIVNEYGEMVGIVTLNDVLSAIVGDFPSEDTLADPEIVQRADGSWLVDGGISIVRLKALLHINTPFQGEQYNHYNTLVALSCLL